MRTSKYSKIKDMKKYLNKSDIDLLLCIDKELTQSLSEDKIEKSKLILKKQGIDYKNVLLSNGHRIK
jgi:predicted nuclease of restriction endonuclease-like RecB superfamily